MADKDDRIKRAREIDQELAPRPWAVRGCDKHADCTGLTCYRIRDANGVPVDGTNKEGLVACRNLAPALADELESSRAEAIYLRERLHSTESALDAERARAEKAERERDEAAFRLAEVRRQRDERNQALKDTCAQVADLERWRERAGLVVEAVRELQNCGFDQSEYHERVAAAVALELPEVG